jgi:hypothetical protein
VKRKAIGLLVIGIWAGGLATLYRRTTHRTLEQELTEVGMRVSPETFYYTLQQGDLQVGVASSAIDTSRTRVTSTDLVRGKFPVGKEVLNVEARSEARFTRGMRMRDFIIRATGDLTPFMVRGVVQEGEEKTLRITTEHGKERPITQEAIAEAPVFIPTVAPLPLALRHEPKIGDSVRVALFDPLSRGLREVTLRIEADSLFLVADSAAFDATSRRWVKARQDSVRGWRITGGNAPLTAWVDRGGRLLAASEPGGITLVRTAFELAFGNWRIDNPASPPVTKKASRRRTGG